MIRSSLAAAAAGVASTFPGLANLIESGDSSAPEVAGSAESYDAATELSTGNAEPLIAHVRDPATGEVGIFNGSREVVVRDPQLVGRILNASK